MSGIRSTAFALRPAALARQIVRSLRRSLQRRVVRGHLVRVIARRTLARPAKATPARVRPPAGRPLYLVLRFRSRNGKLALGGSVGEDNLSASIRNSGAAEVHEYCYDLDYRDSLSAETELIGLAAELRPQLIVLSSYDALDPRLPHRETLKCIRQRLGIPIVNFWWDSTAESCRKRLGMLQQFVDLHVLMESDALMQSQQDPRRFVRLWAPVDPEPFLPRGEPRDIGLSFVGATTDYRSVRGEYLEHLRAGGVELYLAGETRQTMLPYARYAEVLRRSRIAINFSHSVEQTHQLKGRVLEVLFGGAMLLESRNDETRKVLSPGVHYVEFDSKQDLLDKARYFLAHEAERAALAQRGHAHALARFTHRAYWDGILGSLARLGRAV